MPNTEPRPMLSIWGHIAGGPGLSLMDVESLPVSA